MTDQPKPKSIEEQRAQKQFDQLPLHVRSMINDEWRRLREIREPVEDITRGSWI